MVDFLLDNFRSTRLFHCHLSALDAPRQHESTHILHPPCTSMTHFGWFFITGYGHFSGVHKWVNYEAVVVVSGSFLVATRCTRYAPAVFWIHEYNKFYCMYDTISPTRDSQRKCVMMQSQRWSLASFHKALLVFKRSPCLWNNMYLSTKRCMFSTLLRSLDLSKGPKDAQKEWHVLLLPSSLGFANCIHPYLISNLFVPLWYGTIPLHGLVWQVDIQGIRGSW